MLLASSASAIIDIVALVLLTVCVIIGVVKGFANSFISIFGTILSLLFSVLLCSSMAGFLESAFGTITGIASGLNGVLTSIFGDTIMNTPLSSANQGLMSDAGIGLWLISIVLNVKDNPSIPQDTTLNEIICPVFAYYVTAIISVIILFILFKILFFLLGRLVSSLRDKISFLNKTDRILGAVLGLIQGIVYIEFALMIISIIPLGFFQSIMYEVSNTFLVNIISHINLFHAIIGWVTNSSTITSIITQIIK
ncbi:MAG: CvpA family protein [Clostridia bacterium]|nr:CvpA family protein [Clostridia bacterium]